ncbi:MAG: lmrA [Rhodospirillales bacterium]|nr:lmrA [Rhodospirillales bacterium]
MKTRLAKAADTDPPLPVEDTKGRNRRQQILEAAARHFSARGFHATSMRDIAADVGFLVGSIYYHFDSKDALFVAVHGAAVDMMANAVQAALIDVVAPWDRLEAAAAAHCEALNGDNAFVGVVTPIFPVTVGELRNALAAQRDAYETMFMALIAELDLDANIDRNIFRLHVLSALNGTKFWYRPGGKTPSEIGRQLVSMLRPATAAR